MKKHKKFLITVAIIWIVTVLLFINDGNNIKNSVDDQFPLEAEIIENEDKVGANIWLLQAIHGTDGIDYRYAIETDCPKWDFKTRYVTSTPIDWVGEKSAVEVIIYDTQIRYHGTVYASGQYYTVPLFGNVSSENISRDEWKNNLVVQAYQAYQADIKMTWFHEVLTYIVFGLPVIIPIIVFGLNMYGKKEENKGTD